MRVLVTNDDGIHSEGLWTLAAELSAVARVLVVAPDQEQSAIGTAVTLRRPLRLQEIASPLAEVSAYSVTGTPSDCVILALEKLAAEKVDLVFSGINRGLNLGEDVLISGTVGGAMQAYLRGYPVMAVSMAFGNGQKNLKTGGRLAALLATRIAADPRLTELFLNVNLPDAPPEEIREIAITRLASESHLNTVAEQELDGQMHYLLLRRQAYRARNRDTDIWAVEQGNVSITPLYTKRFNKLLLPLLQNISATLLDDLRRKEKA